MRPPPEHQDTGARRFSARPAARVTDTSMDVHHAYCTSQQRDLFFSSNLAVWRAAADDGRFLNVVERWS